MKISKKVLIILTLLISVMIAFYIKQARIHYSLKNVTKQIATLDPVLKPQVVFDNKGAEDIMLIMMVKDEGDIIYENLVWHFCFRLS